MTTVLQYEDPLISLVKDPELNRSKEKSNELLTIINSFQSKDQHRIKKKCILGFQVLRDLERLQLRTKNWEFLSLDFSIESILNDDRISDAKSKFNREIAKKVLSNCVEMHELINEMTDEIEDINRFIKSMNTFEYISDPGTILTQLTLRTINLKNKLSDELTILYSKLKLINIGIDLERLLENCDFEKFNETTIENYRDFINQLLRQLNDAIKLNDSIEILECIEIVNDVEQMFESISLDNRYLKETEEPLHHESDIETFDISLESSSDETPKLFERRRRLSLSSVSTSTSMLQKTTLQDELPHLMSAFDMAKNVEEEVRELRTPKTKQSVSPQSSSFMERSNKPQHAQQQQQQQQKSQHKQKTVYFGPSLPPSQQQHAIPQQETFIPTLPNSYMFDNNSSILGRFGIKPQVIHLDTILKTPTSLSPLSSPPTSSSQLFLKPALDISQQQEKNSTSAIIGINSVWNHRKNNTLTETNLNRFNNNDIALSLKQLRVNEEDEVD